MKIKNSFKGLDRCLEHDKLYHWKNGCPDCKREDAKHMKPIDKTLKEMEEEGILPENEKGN